LSALNVIVDEFSQGVSEGIDLLSNIVNAEFNTQSRVPGRSLKGHITHHTSLEADTWVNIKPSKMLVKLDSWRLHRII
jgi:hypothetical protein